MYFHNDFGNVKIRTATLALNCDVALLVCKTMWQAGWSRNQSLRESKHQKWQFNQRLCYLVSQRFSATLLVKYMIWPRLTALSLGGTRFGPGDWSVFRYKNHLIFGFEGQNQSIISLRSDNTPTGVSNSK